jgi:hypothetical protein
MAHSETRRQTVDLTAYPDLIIIYLGMRAQSFRGVMSLLRLGPQIQQSVAARPDGLLLHEDIIFSLIPLHLGMRQYWRDFDALERWARTLPHQQWWIDFRRDNGGTGFWHELYTRSGGMEAFYDSVTAPVGLMRFAPLQPARGSMFSARHRLRRDGDETVPTPVPEAAIYGPAPDTDPARR